MSRAHHCRQPLLRVGFLSKGPDYADADFRAANLVVQHARKDHIVICNDRHVLAVARRPPYRRYFEDGLLHFGFGETSRCATRIKQQRSVARVAAVSRRSQEPQDLVEPEFAGRPGDKPTLSAVVIQPDGHAAGSYQQQHRPERRCVRIAPWSAATAAVFGTLVARSAAEDRMAKTTTGRKKAAKRELIDTGTDKRFVRRGSKGQFKESDDVGKSLAADRGKKAKTKAKRGQGDKGDR